MSTEISYLPAELRSWPTTCVWFLWQIVRLPALTVLLVLEPLVCLILTTVAFLGFVSAATLNFDGSLPHFPFLAMVGFSLGAILLRIAYNVLIELLSQE